MEDRKLQLSQEQKKEQISLKFEKTIRTLRLSQNYPVLIKTKSVSDKQSQTSNFI